MTIKLSPLFDVKLIKDGRSHFYEIDNDPSWKPGVTTALGMINKPALVQWASNMACQNIKEYLFENSINRPLSKEEIEKACLEGKNIYKKKSQEATDIGSRVHVAIDKINKGEEATITDDIKPAVDGFLEWEKSNGLTISMGDTKIGSKLFGFGGSLDMVAFRGSEAIIIDLKTNKKRKGRKHGIYPETAMQLSAYAQAFRETYGLEVKEVYALWLDKEKPDFKAVKVVNLKSAFDGFLACLKLYNLSKFEMFEEENYE